MKNNYFFRFLEPAKYNMLILLAVLFIGLISTGFELYSVNILKEVTDLILQKDLDLVYTKAYVYMLILAIFYTLSFIFRNFETIYFFKTRQIIYKLIVDKFIKLENSKVELMGTGKLIAILKDGIFTWGELQDLLFYSGFQSIIRILASFLLIYFISPKYFLGSIIIFVILTIILYYLDKYTNTWRKQRRDERNNQVKQMVKIIMSKFEILQNNKLLKEISTLIDIAKRESYFGCKTNTGLWYMYNVPKLFIDLTRFFIIFFVGIGVIKGAFSIGEFVMFGSLLLILDSALVRFVTFFKDFNRHYVDIEKLFETIDSIPEIKNYDKGIDFEYQKGEIELRNLNFSYDGNKIFENFSLKIEGGKKIAIVGPSGGGKTTLIKLIAGFLECQKGQVFIDGQDISQIALKTYYKYIGYLTQEPSIIDASVLENLTYGIDKEIREDEVKESLDLSESEFVNKLEKGIYTEIGERGIRLSGGQRQRLAIAKLFLKAPKIVILDEPTSALDSFSEDKITKALERLFRKKTVVVVAHRLQTVKEADEIIVIDKGGIVERGSHEELVAKGGIYSEMVDLQSGLIK